jgi:hypothetical protein
MKFSWKKELQLKTEINIEWDGKDRKSIEQS